MKNSNSFYPLQNTRKVIKMDALKNKIQSVLLVILLLSTNYCVMLKKNDPEQWKTSWDQLKSLLEIGKEIRIIDHYDRRFLIFRL